MFSYIEPSKLFQALMSAVFQGVSNSFHRESLVCFTFHNIFWEMRRNDSHGASKHLFRVVLRIYHPTT